MSPWLGDVSPSVLPVSPHNTSAIVDTLRENIFNISNVSGCPCGRATVGNESSSGQNVSEGSGNYSFHWCMRTHHPLRAARLYRSSSRVKVARGEN